MGESFDVRWDRKWSACGFPDIGIQFVACGGDVLPDSAAPSLDFARAAAPAPIWEVYGRGSHWSHAERERLAAYRVIGSDGAGNPICVDRDSGAVVLLDHEDGFRTRQFVNGTVAQLAESLLAYMGERDPEQFRSAVNRIDLDALAEGAFWWHEATGVGPRP